MTDDVSPQRELGHYRLLRMLGEGGMGQVYLAEDLRLQRQVAIKCLKDEELNKDEKRRKRLLNEARMQAQLNHPNTVHLYDVILEPGQTALVMEYVDGTNLSEYLREHCIDTRQKLVWLQQITMGLSAAHAKGLIHRDLKAANILIDRSGIAKITDFGIAKDQRNDTELTETENFVGSYTALSPEQAMGSPVDARSDLFSLGILACRMLFGQHPFGCTDNRNVLVQNILHSPPVLPMEANPAVSESCLRLLVRLLAKQPEDRPQTALVVSHELRMCIEQYTEADMSGEMTETLTSSSSDYAAHQPISHLFSRLFRPIAKWKRGASLVISAAIIVIVCGYWFSVQPEAPLFIAVFPPVVEDNGSMDEQQQILLQAAVTDSLQRYILTTDNLHLINPTEIAAAEGNRSNMARSLGADVFLESTISCRNQFCEIRLNRVQPGTDQVENSAWILESQQHWKVLDTDDLLSLNRDTVGRVSTLFPGYPFARDDSFNTLTEPDYQQFLLWYHNVVILGTEYEETLDALTAAQSTYQLYLPFYDLYHIISIRLFDDTQEQKYLQLLEIQLNKAKKLLPQQLLIERISVNLYLSQENHEAAYASYERFLKLHPLEEEALALLATVEGYIGSLEEAIRLLERVVQIRPTRSYWFDLARFQIMAGKLDDAKNSLDKVFSLNENEYEALQLQGHIAVMESDMNIAISAFKQASSINPLAQNFSNLGVAYLLNRDLTLAHSAFQKALNDAPNHAVYVLNLADSLKLLSKNEEAEVLYRKVLDLEKGQDDWNSLLNIAQAYAHLGRAEDAIGAVHSSLRLSPDNSEALFTAALVYSVSEEWNTALVSIRESVSQGMSPVWYSLPWFDPLCSAIPESFNEILSTSTTDSLRCTTN